MPISRREFLDRTAAGLAVVGAPALHLGSADSWDLVVRGGNVFDGSGAVGRVADIAIRAGRIAAVSPTIKGRGSDEIDARGLAVAPGFIDIHSHGDGTLVTDPRAESVIRQGVTTIVVGQDGSSRVPNRNGETSLGPWRRRLEALPTAVNVATMVGLGTVRRVVVGEDDRPATPAELSRMVALVEEALVSGACGASTGLEYTPGAFARLDELVALCRPLRRRQLPYATHMRNEDDRLLEAVDEAIAIARGARAPLQISHLKTGGTRNWGKVDQVLARIETAAAAGLDVTFDRYPYVAWATGLTNMFPVWALDGGGDAFLRRLGDSLIAPKIKAEALDKVALVGGWHNVLLANVEAPADKAAIGMRLDDWAGERGMDGYDGAVTLLRNSRTNVSTVVFAMSEENLERFLSHPRAMVCSDGGAFAVDGPARTGHPHPRGIGTFPRVLGRYVRERKVLTLEQAIHKMTGMPARRLRLSTRGRVAAGAAADLVLFDPATVADRGTFDDPFQYPSGIPTVIVNGAVTLREGARTGTGQGKTLRPAGPSR